MKKIIVFICLFLFVFLGCRKDKNSTEFFENSLIYKIAEELYFDNSLADIFKNRIGLGLKCQIFETKSKSYTAVFPQINTYGDGWLEMYGKDVDGTIVFSGDSTISAKKLPEGRKVIEFEFTVPENWKSIASIFDETYDKKISIIKKVLIRFTENERKSDGNTFFIAPFTIYSNGVWVLWVEGERGYKILLDDEDALLHAPGMAVRDIQLKNVKQTYINNSLNDGRKIMIKSK